MSAVLNRERAESIGGTFPRRFGDEAIRKRVE